MHADLWGWFNRYTTQAFMEGNPLKQRLALVYDQGWEALRAEESERALALFQEGLDIARRLREPCWELFFEYWSAETYIFYLTDYKTGLDRAVKMAARAHKDAYLPCPVRARVYYTLLYTYFLMDALGYEDKIREMLDYMEREIPLDTDTQQRMQYIRAGMAFALEDYDACEREIQQYMDMCVGNTHRESGGYNMLRRIAYARGDVRLAFDYAYQFEHRSRRARLQNSVSHALICQGTYAQFLGQTERAAKLIEQGKAHHARYGLKRMSTYFDHLCQYHELLEEPEEALRLREEQLAEMREIDSVDYITYVHLQHCRLRGRMGLDLTDALQAAYEAAGKLLKPQQYLDKLKRVESGDYTQYEWEKAP